MWDNLNLNAQTWIFEKVSEEEEKHDQPNFPTNNNAVPSKGCGRDLRLTKTGSFEFNWSRGKALFGEVR